MLEGKRALAEMIIRELEQRGRELVKRASKETEWSFSLKIGQGTLPSFSGKMAFIHHKP